MRVITPFVMPTAGVLRLPGPGESLGPDDCGQDAAGYGVALTRALALWMGASESLSAGLRGGPIGEVRQTHLTIRPAAAASELVTKRGTPEGAPPRGPELRPSVAEKTSGSDKSLLCLSWLDGSVMAVAVNHGAVGSSWERPDRVPDFSDFLAVLTGAVEHTRSGARQVAMVMAHPRHIHQILEMPPAKGGTLAKFLLRRVQTLKTFDEEAAWASQPAMPTKNSNAVLLHIFPKSLVDQLVAAGEKAHLQFVRLIPTTSVLIDQLKRLSVPKSELALLVAETGSTTTVVIGTSDGRVCLGRVLRASWNQELDSLAVDLARTIGFAEQQSGIGVGSVWLFGAGAQDQVPALQAALQLPVKLSPVEYSPFYWAEQAAKLPEKDDGNLISLQVLEAPKRRRLLTATGLILLFLLVFALAVSGFIEMLRREWLRTLVKERAAMVQLQDIRNEMLKRHQELQRKREFVQIVLDEKPSAAPAWFLGYMSEAIPPELLLTELHVARTNDGWSVKMAGVAQPPTNSAPASAPAPAVFRRVMSSMTNELVTGPFQLKISRSVLGGGGGTAGLRERTNNTFLIEGTIQ